MDAFLKVDRSPTSQMIQELRGYVELKQDSRINENDSGDRDLSESIDFMEDLMKRISADSDNKSGEMKKPVWVRWAIQGFLVKSLTSVVALRVDDCQLNNALVNDILDILLASFKVGAIDASYTATMLPIVFESLPTNYCSCVLKHMIKRYDTWNDLIYNNSNQQMNQLSLVKALTGLRKRNYSSSLNELQDNLQSLVITVISLYMPWTDPSGNNVQGRWRPAHMGRLKSKLIWEVSTMRDLMRAFENESRPVMHRESLTVSRQSKDIVDEMHKNEAYGYPSRLSYETGNIEYFLDASHGFLSQLVDDHTRMTILYQFYINAETILVRSARTHRQLETLLRLLWSYASERGLINSAMSAEPSTSQSSISPFDTSMVLNGALWNRIHAYEPYPDVVTEQTRMIEGVADQLGDLSGALSVTSAKHGAWYKRSDLPPNESKHIRSTMNSKYPCSMSIRNACATLYRNKVFHLISGRELPSEKYIPSGVGGWNSFYRQLRCFKISDLRWLSQKLVSFKYSKSLLSKPIPYDASMVENLRKQLKPRRKYMYSVGTPELSELFAAGNMARDDYDMPPPKPADFNDRIQYINEEIAELEGNHADAETIRKAEIRRNILQFKSRRARAYPLCH